MTRWGKPFLSVALAAALLHALVLTGCGGGGSSPTGSPDRAEVRLRLGGLTAPRVAAGAFRSAAVAGATVFVDGVQVGVTDASGEIVLRLEPGTHTITVSAGGVTSTPFQVTIEEGDVLTLEVEMEKDGTLVVEQDKDHDGDVDDDDLDDDSDDDDDDDLDDDDDGDDDVGDDDDVDDDDDDLEE